MSRLDDLPPDQRATLSLLLRNRKSYAEVASLLSIPERAVHDRAHAALAVLAATQARELTPERRAEIGDYLLGQRAGVADRLATRTYLDGSPQARAWAGALAGELEPLAGGSLPEIPDGRPAGSAGPVRDERGAGEPTRSAPPPAGAPPGSAAPSSRRAGALLLAGLLVAAVVAVVLIADGGGSSHKRNGSGAGAGGASTSTSTTKNTSSAQAGRAKEDRRITLRPTDPASKAIGVAEVLSEANKYAFYLAAEHLPPSQGFFYAVWLYNSPSSFQALSRSPPVGSNGRLQGGALLPSNAGNFHRMLLTRENSSRPTRPGPIVLSGGFALH